MSLRIQVLEREQAKEVDTKQWDQLAKQSEYSNPFYERWNLIPALSFLEKGHVSKNKVYLVTAYLNDTLIALFPVSLIKHPIGISYLNSWNHSQCFLSDPLCSESRYLGNISAKLLRIFKVKVFKNDLHSANAFGNFLSRHAVSFTVDRGAIFKVKELNAYLKTLPKRVRQENKRISGRLFVNDDVYYTNSNEKPELNWLDLFCQLEDAGWKKKVKGSILSDSAVYNYYQALHKQNIVDNCIEYQGIFKGDTVLAISIRLTANKRGYDIKTCYNEEYRKLYPGVNLELCNMRALSHTDLTYVDSCTSSENFLINRLWPDQIRNYSSLLFHGGVLGRILKVIYQYKNRKQLAMLK